MARSSPSWFLLSLLCTLSFGIVPVRSAAQTDIPQDPRVVTSSRSIAGACVIARVLDGDTVDCEGGARIRLLLIDAQEISQSSFGLRARLALEEMLPRATRPRSSSTSRSGIDTAACSPTCTPAGPGWALYGRAVLLVL